MKIRYIVVSLACLLIWGLFLLHASRNAPQITNNVPIPLCADTSGQHLNSTSSAVVCGTSAPSGMVTQTGGIVSGHMATWNASGVIQDSGASPYAVPLTGTTSSIGGSLLAAGACASGTATISGATTSMIAMAQASDGSNISGLGADVSAVVTASNTVTVNVCALVLLTPPAKTYNVRVIQ